MMKRITCLVSLFLLILSLPLTALAATTVQPFLPLSNETLIDILRSSDYKDWTFYQPDSREIDYNTSSGYSFDRLLTYPVLAVREDDLCLIVLEKVNDQWKIAAANEQALTRDGFTLTGFSIDDSSPEQEQYVFFDFEDNQKERWTLCLTLSDIYPSCFLFLQRPEGSITFNYDRGLTFPFYYPSIFQCSYEIIPEKLISYDVDEFSFAACPLSMDELFTPVLVSPKNEVINFYTRPDESTEPVFQLGKAETISILSQQGTDWVLAKYNGNIYFIHKDDMAMSNEL